MKTQQNLALKQLFFMKKIIIFLCICFSLAFPLQAQDDNILGLSLDSLKNDFIRSSIKNQWQIDSSGYLRFRLNVYDYIYNLTVSQDLDEETIRNLLGTPLGIIVHDDDSYTLGYILMRNPNADLSNGKLSKVVTVAAFRFDEKQKSISCDDMEFLFGSRLDLFWNRCDSLRRGLIKE